MYLGADCPGECDEKVKKNGENQEAAHEM
jgi:hypothetical protein